MTGRDEFLQSFGPAVNVFLDHVKKGHRVRIVTHNDADGLSSGGIVSVAAHRAGACFKVTSEKKLDEKLVQALREEDPPLVVFTDFGSGYLDIIGESLSQDVIVLDHHICVEQQSSNIFHVNPMLHGIDGAREIAASGISYMFAKALDPVNTDLSCLALVGALGDQQDKGERKNLTGLNTLIEEDAAKAGLLDKHVGLIFYGYETRPLPKAIAYTTTPYIPGLSGNEGNCVAFLKQIGVELSKGEQIRALADLSEDETRTLFSALSSHMVSTGCDPSSVHDLIGTIYTFRLEDPGTALRSGREYSSLLNACGRMGKAGVGLSICLGDRGDAMAEAQQTLDEYRRRIGSALDLVQVKGMVEELEGIYVIKAGDQIDDTVIGVVSGILLGQGLLKGGKPIVATARSEDDQVKVSARGTEELARGGLHMGLVMRDAAEAMGGGGGGHDVAAGAYIPVDKEEEFIAKVNSLVREKRAK
jgi:single-stranded-DNA-specific exonuclease